MHFGAYDRSSEEYLSPEEDSGDDHPQYPISFPPVLPQIQPRARPVAPSSRFSPLQARGQHHYEPFSIQRRVNRGLRQSSRRNNIVARSHPYQNYPTRTNLQAQQSSQRILFENLQPRNTQAWLLNEQEVLAISSYGEDSSSHKVTRRHLQEINLIETSRFSSTVQSSESRIVELNPSQGDEAVVSHINMSALRRQYDNATILGINNRLKSLAQKLNRSRTYLHACMDLYTWCQSDSAYCLHTEKTLIHCLKIIVRKSRRFCYNVNYGWQVLRVVHQHLLYFQERRREIVTRMYTAMCELSNNPVDPLPVMSPIENDWLVTDETGRNTQYNSHPVFSSNAGSFSIDPSSSLLPTLFIGETGEMLRRIGGAVESADDGKAVHLKLEDRFTDAEVTMVPSLEDEIPSIEVKEEKNEIINDVEPEKHLPILQRFLIPFFILAEYIRNTASSTNFDLTDIEYQSLPRKQKSPQPLEPTGVFLVLGKKDMNTSWPEITVFLNNTQIPIEVKLLKDRERHYIDISGYCLKKNELEFIIGEENPQKLQNVNIAVKLNAYKPISYLESELRNKCIKAEQGKELAQYLVSKYQPMPLAYHSSIQNQIFPTTLSEVGDTAISISQPSIWLSLRCPLNHQRIRTPVRGVRCKHIGCFDLAAYLHINAVRPTWECPICDLDLPLEELGRDVMLENVLAEITEPAILDLKLTPHANLVKGRRTDGCWLEFQLKY